VPGELRRALGPGGGRSSAAAVLPPLACAAPFLAACSLPSARFDVPLRPAGIAPCHASTG